MAARLPEKLIDKPSFLASSFQGYSHSVDPTLLPFNVLTFPSINCSIPDFDKIIPDKGKLLLGQAFDENIGINGNMEKFKNAGGLEMEVRVFPSADLNLRDVIQIYYTNDRLLFTTLVGTFAEGATVVGATSNATGIVTNILNSVLTLSNITGDFIVGETITQSIPSVATAVVVSPPVSLWRQITENNNLLPRGEHEYYFDQWFDSDPITPSNSINLPRLIWVNGTFSVFSWTGGVALITGVTATSIIIDPSTTWRSLGFTETAAGLAFVVVNGVSYQLTTPADLSTNVINVASTAGISVGDYATARIEVDAAPIPFDMCRMNKNFMFYGNWSSRDLYMSNKFNHISTTVIGGAQAFPNDLIISDTTNFNGLGSHVYKVVIDSIEPDVLIQSFTGIDFYDATYRGTGGTDLPIGYTGTPGALNHYKVSMMADALIVLTTAAVFTPGETIIGANSLAEAKVVVVEPIGPGGDNVLGVEMISGNMFWDSEIITGSIIGHTGTTSQAQYQNWIQYTKNNDVVNIDTGSGPMPIAPLQSATPITLSDGLEIKFANFRGHAVGDVFALDIRVGGQDTFTWSLDGGVPSASIPITGGNQVIADGIVISFVNQNGHSLGDFWNLQADQEITRAWDNFYFSPIRKPGEGFKFLLPSNFWTMDTQEESMYVNGSYGEWSVVSTILSGDLTSEDVSLTPLKQAGANKVLYPYLTGHINNDLVYVTVTKHLDFIGRQQFLEKPQIGYLSEPVDLDFQESSFVGGRIKYLNKKLFISSPENALMHTYDTYKKYWQPPKSFPETAILSIFGNDLVAHSNVRNQSFLMFRSPSDNGQSYNVVIRTPYTSVEDRWNKKFSSMSFTEGYIQGNPILTHTVYLGVNGCGGIFPHTISPIVCIAPDNAPIGEGALGNHALGSDVGIPGNYFQEIYKSYSPTLRYYFLAIEISCAAKNHSWALLSSGMNGMYASTGNNELVNPNNLVVNNP